MVGADGHFHHSDTTKRHYACHCSGLASRDGQPLVNDLGIDGIHKTLATFYVTATDETNDDEANAAFDYFS